MGFDLPVKINKIHINTKGDQICEILLILGAMLSLESKISCWKTFVNIEVSKQFKLEKEIILKFKLLRLLCTISKSRCQHVKFTNIVLIFLTY